MFKSCKCGQAPALGFITMKLAVICFVVLALSPVVLGFPGSTEDNGKSTQLKADNFDMILKVIKTVLCNGKSDANKDSDDLFQMILELARIFLCDD